MLTSDGLLDHLRLCNRGERNGASARALASALGCNERDVRQAVMALRERGYPVCALPATGYFLAASEAELKRTLAFLRDRAKSTFDQVRCMERVSLDRLRGQADLPFEEVA